jgi:hypothetical protein
VVYYAQDTVILTTFFVTTTIPASDTPYILTFTDKKSAAITEVIGVNAASKSSEPSTSSPPLTSSSQDSTSSLNTSPSNPSSANSSGGLSSGAKIGIGIAIPLVFIALAVVGTLFFLRRRKRARQTRPQPQETHDGGLPEPASTINVLEKFKEYPPSYRGPHVEAGGAPIAEMNQDQQRSDGTGSSLLFSHELNAAQQGQRQDLSSSPLPELNANQQRYEASGNHMTSDQELSADQARYEVSGNPAQVGHELSTQPHTPSPIPTLPVFSPTKEPVPVRTASPGPSSSFPPPWDSTGTAEYERKLNIGPAEAAAAEDQDLRELEEEVARVKMQKQRLQELQALEAREEELRRSIVERKKITAKGKV